jgi:hypothetical protein
MLIVAFAVISVEDVSNTKKKLKISVVSDVTLCSLVEVYRRCGGICCPHVLTSQTTAVFIGLVHSLRTSDLIKREFVVLLRLHVSLFFALFNDAISSTNYIASNQFKY